MIELTLRSTAILAGAWLLTRALPRATAATRHLVWHGALVAIVAAPILSPIVPRIPLPIPAIADTLVPRATAWISAVGAVPSSSRATFTANDDAAIPDRASIPAAHRTPSPQTTSVPLGSVMVVGTVATGLWFVLSWLMTFITVRRAALAPLAWQLEINALREKLRIDGHVRLRILREVTSPLATGVFRPTILMPEAATAWSAERRRAVLLHELAHVRRHDCRVQLIAHVACALHWYNPFVWMAASRLRLERERACDDEVIRTGTQPSSYASHLLDIARELRPALRPSAALAMARRPEIEGRLLAVLSDRKRAPLRGTRWAIAAVLCSLTAVALGASSRHSTIVAATVPPATVKPSLSQDVVSSAARVSAARARSEATASLRESSDPGTRQQAAMNLTEATEPEALAPLRRALSDPSPDVREKAALALSFMSGADVVPALLQALGDPDSQVREKAAIGLALRRDARVIEPLVAAMRDPDSQVREKVAIALGTSGDPRARKPMVDAMGDADSQVREKAAAALVLLGMAR